MTRYGDGYGWRRGFPPPGYREHGGMHSDAYRSGDPERRRVRAEFGWGGGNYDVDFPHRGHPGMYHGERQRSGWRELAPRSERMRIVELMTPNPETITPGDTLVEAARRMRRLDVGMIPVAASRESRRLVGVITDPDLAIRAVAEDKPGSTPVSDCMSQPVATIHRNSSVRRAIELMSRKRLRRLPVVDGEGRLVGILAQADLAVDYAGFDPEREIAVEEMIERISEPARPRRPLPGAPPPDLAHVHGGYVFGPTDRGGDVGFRPAGSRGLDEW